MSNKFNDRLVDEIRELEEVVQFHIDYWSGKVWERVLSYEIREAKKTLDPTKINKLLMESSKEMFELEYQPTIAEYKKQHPRAKSIDLSGVPF